MHRKFRCRAVVGFLLVACGATLGCSMLATGPRMVDDAVVDRASALGDADLMADVKSLHNNRLRGQGNLQAGMCLQQYVRGRAAQAELATTQDDYGRRVARTEMLSGFGTCAVQCKLATDLGSKYTSTAAKYIEPCEAGASASEQAMGIDYLERLVAVFRDATQPLGLFLAHKDATEAIDALRKQNVVDETFEQLAVEVKSLHDKSSEAIARGSKFFYSAPAQENFQVRAQLESEIEVVTATMEQLQPELREARDTGRSADAQTLQLALAAHQLRLEELVQRNARLQSQYEKMAAEVGVYVRP